MLRVLAEREGIVVADIDKQALRKLAESQAQEPWFKSGDLEYHDKRTGETHGIHHDDDAFIVAASPATALALLDEIATLEGLYRMHRETEERQMIELRAEVAALREVAMRLVDLQNSERGPVQSFKLWNDVADQARRLLGLEVRNG